MKHFGDYLRSRLGTIILCVCLFGVFAAADLLFEVETIVLWYPLILGAVLLLVVGAVDYVMFLKKHKELSYGELPTPKSLIEEDYQSIIAKLKEEAEMRASSASQDYNNMIEYYTVWAHQIKTPIAAMRLNLQSEDSESARKLMGDLNRIESYVEMVLTFLRLDSDSTDYVIKEHDLDEIIKSSVRKFSREFILKKLTLNYEPVKYKCITDEKWLEFIIEQVISNAVKYTSEGGVRIYMDEPGLLVIEDTGIGISAEDLPRIFENGYTGFNGREDKRASGIGLYLCKRIADNLGHKITAESTPRVGTKMIIDVRGKNLGVE
ncbi:MAG: sensor histidine kinase [Clostridiales bacterium]|nr:sensor histidine kinase [Clostridiales bacterium]